MDQLATEVANMISTYGPVVIVLYAVFAVLFIAIFGVVLWFFVKLAKSLFDEFKDM